MSATILSHQVLRDNELQDCRLVASIPVIELHRLIVGISTLHLDDISLTVAGDRMMARSNTKSFLRSGGRGDELYARSYAKYEFALDGMQLLVTKAFLNGVHLKIRKFGIEGAQELIHFFVNNDERIGADNIISELFVLIPPNHYHKNPVHSWKRIKPQPGTWMSPQDESLFNAADTLSSCRQVRISADVFRQLPIGDQIVLRCNGEDQWTFRNVTEDETFIEVQRADWFRLLSGRNSKVDVLEEPGDCFSAEHLPQLSERALSVLADRAVYRSS